MIRINGETSYTTYSGGTTKDKFVEYLKNVLIPTLHDGDIIVMDNMRSHHIKEVLELINNSEKYLTLLYLPPYSPDFNPIEMMWSPEFSAFVFPKTDKIGQHYILSVLV